MIRSTVLAATLALAFSASQAAPNYYFGVETLKELFPRAEVVSTPAVLEKLRAKVNKGEMKW